MTITTHAPALEGTRRPREQTIGYFISFIALGLVSASLGPTLPGLANLTHSPLRDISFLFSARALGYLLGSLVCGRLYDRSPGHPVMIVVLLVISAMLVLIPLTAWLWLLLLVMLLLGSSEGALDVGANTLIVWVHGHKVGPFMNALHFFFGVGAFLSPIIIAQVMEWGNLQWAYWMLALLLLPSALWLVRLASPRPQHEAEHMRGIRVRPGLVMFIMLFLFVYAGAEIGFGGWIFTYAVSLQLANETQAAYLTSTFWGALTLGRLLAIPMAARLRPRVILFADLLGALFSISVIVLGSQSLPITWLGTFGLGLTLASIFPTILAFAERRMTITGQVTGWFFVGSSTGSMLLPWLMGQVFDRINPQATMLMVVLYIVAALGLLAVLILHARKKD